MRLILLGMAAVIVLSLVAVIAFLRRPGLTKALPVTAKPLLSRAEQVLYGRLVRAFPGHVILAQVALSQMLVADFVVCTPDFTALAVIELDDRSHHRNAQRERDQRKDQFLQAAGIKVIRIAVSDIPSEAALKALVAAMSITLPATPLARRA